MQNEQVLNYVFVLFKVCVCVCVCACLLFYCTYSSLFEGLLTHSVNAKSCLHAL